MVIRSTEDLVAVVVVVIEMEKDVNIVMMFFHSLRTIEHGEKQVVLQ